MVQEYSDAVIVTADEDDLKEFLRKTGVPPAAVAAMTPADFEALGSALKAITESENNTGGGGGVLTITGKRHFRLRKAIFVGICAGVALSASLLSANPLAVAAACLGSIQSLSSLVTTLNDVELEVCIAIREIMQQREVDGDARPGATEADIAAKMQHDAPSNLHDVIVHLTGGAAPVLKTDTAGGETRYILT